MTNRCPHLDRTLYPPHAPMMALARFASALLSAALLAAACGGISTSSGEDAGPADAKADPPQSPPSDARDDTTLTDAGPTYDTCDASSDASAPDGGCDFSRIVLVHRSGAACAPVGVGTFCDNFQFGFAGLDAAAVPAGFGCGHELGVSTCVWQAADGGTVVTLDDSALNAACEATVSFPGAQVECIVY